MSGEPGITRSRFVIALVIVVWTFFGTDTPRGAEVCDFNNSVSQNPTVVTIDAVTGLITDRTHVRRGKPVRIQLINKNPFKYVYSTSIDVQTLDESKTITGGPALNYRLRKERRPPARRNRRLHFPSSCAEPEADAQFAALTE